MIKNKQNIIIFWILSVILMYGFGVYQRMTGPSYPVRGNVMINSNEIKFKLPRSSEGEDNAYVTIEVPDQSVKGIINYQKYKSLEDWKQADMIRDGNNLKFLFPRLENAGKFIYKISLITATATTELTKEPVIIRFRGAVPALIMIFHIIFMALSLTLCFRAFFEAMMNGNNLLIFTILTAISLSIGALVLGPIVQKYSFGVYWSGFPFGHDLTDNKAILGVLLWVIAWWRVAVNPKAKGWVIAAAILLIIVYLIPHSMFGSEIDYTKLPQN